MAFSRCNLSFEIGRALHELLFAILVLHTRQIPSSNFSLRNGDTYERTKTAVFPCGYSRIGVYISLLAIMF